MEENPLLLTKSINCKTIGPKVETFARYHNANVWKWAKSVWNEC